MATATQQVQVVHGSDVESAPHTHADPQRVPAPSVARGEYRCQCGHALRVSGGGRHRVYFELDDDRSEDPVMNRVCPQCGRSLAGKN